MNSPQTQEKYDVIVIGGGASGMMAAGVAGARGKRVLLIEKNKRLGEKLRITGGGRCNITNDERDIHALLSNYKSGKDFLYSPFSIFGVKETFEFFEGRGLPLFVEARKRAFPKSEKASDVCDVLVKYLKENNVMVLTDCAVTKLLIENKKISQVITKKGVFEGESVVVSTGGLSHPETGSTGDGFAWLSELGHTIHEPTPTIVPLTVEESWIKELAGISIGSTDNPMKLSFFVDGKKAFAKTGKLLCTHFGLSGPLVLNSAKEVSDLLHKGVVIASIDTYPTVDQGTLEKQMIELFDQNKNKALKNVFSELAPKGTSRVLFSLVPHIDPDLKTHSVSKEMRKDLCKLLKALPLSISGLLGFDKAVVADGGVDIREVDTKTMRSTKIANLFLTGDMIHIDRPSGGFSLQLCWTTGYVAGKNA
ncbi:MAG: aminoacetone oxidase family FAD-binding enzyme [Candidatus Zambryskibacteria bacterium]|nr:aminoacetone oxidase family FAD-binding enzyme [Candidatus Zambryskibacteria bacterium]